MGTEGSRAPKAGPLGYGMAPVAVAGGITLLCGVGLLVGGFGVVANALSPQAAPAAAQSSPAPGETNDGEPSENASPIPAETGNGQPSATGSPGAETPAPSETTGTDAGTGTSTIGPTAPPERGSAPATAQPADTVYWIRWGDTLSQISLDTGVSVEHLVEYNAIRNADLIYADEALHIPYARIPGA